MGSLNLGYTGAEVEVTVPPSITSMIVDMAGAQGGASYNGSEHFIARKGGRIQCTIPVTPGEILRIGVAGKGNDRASASARAFHEGATRATADSITGDSGGQSYIKRGGTTFLDRICVAAGAAGGCDSTATSKADGGWRLDTEAIVSTAAKDALVLNCGPGGSGWVGGEAGENAAREGQGGTNMAHTTKTSSVTSTRNYQEGNGYVNLEWTDPPNTGNRSFPVPAYSTNQLLNGNDKRKLRTTSPGTTDSTATKGLSASLLSSSSYYLKPEQTAVSGTLLSSGNASGVGFGYVPSESGNVIVPNNTDGFKLSEGSFTFQIVAIRAGGFLTANISATFTVIVFRANSNATSFIQELGRATPAAKTITTTKTAFPITVGTVAAEFEPGEIIWVEIFASTTSSGTSADTPSFHTNSTTGLRITAAPPYYRLYNKSLSDTNSLSDILNRQNAYKRSMSESSSISDSLIRQVNRPRSMQDTISSSDNLQRVAAFPRSLQDTISISESLIRQVNRPRAMQESISISESLVRVATFPRNLSETSSISDTLIRNVSFKRGLAESISINDTFIRVLTAYRRLSDSSSISDILYRQVAYKRPLSDSISPVTENLLRAYTANRILNDTITVVSETFTRILQSYRSLNDNSTVTESFLRQATYARKLEDVLSSGTNITVVKKKVLVFDK